jgi:hypothetical protein
MRCPSWPRHCNASSKAPSRQPLRHWTRGALQGQGGLQQCLGVTFLVAAGQLQQAVVLMCVGLRLYRAVRGTALLDI